MRERERKREIETELVSNCPCRTDFSNISFSRLLNRLLCNGTLFCTPVTNSNLIEHGNCTMVHFSINSNGLSIIDSPSIAMICIVGDDDDDGDDDCNTLLRIFSFISKYALLSLLSPNNCHLGKLDNES